MRTLLISLLPTTENLGIKYIHSYLLQQGHTSSILFVPTHDLQVEKPLLDFVHAWKPDIIGCSLMSHNASFTAFLGNVLKQNLPDILFVVGGIHPTIAPEECLEYADLVCLSEGEETLREIVEHLADGTESTEIQNIAFKHNGTIQKNPLRPLEQDLDRFPFAGHFPQHSFVYHQKKILPMDGSLFRQYTRYNGKSFYIMTSRGCPYSCSYCCNSFLKKIHLVYKVRKRSPQNVIAELRSVITEFPEILFINFHDDCFMAHTHEWHQEFLHDYKKWIRRPFLVCSTPQQVTEEKIRMLKDAGLSWLAMGLQSGSERICRDIYQRPIARDSFIEAARIAKKYGVSGYYDIILDNPFEREEDVIDTVNVLTRVPKPYQLQLFSLTFYRGTKLHEMARTANLLDETDFYIKNYFAYKKTYLNMLIRIAPLLPATLINHFIQKRNRLLERILLTVLYYLITIAVEPFSYFYLMTKGFNNRWDLTLKMSLPTFKTKMKERISYFADHVIFSKKKQVAGDKNLCNSASAQK